MLKVDKLGWDGTKVNPNGYRALLDEVRHCTATLHLSDGDSGADSAVPATDAVGGCRIRHVGTGHVAEGHVALTVANKVDVELDKCNLTLAAEITRVIPEGATQLDLSDLFGNGEGDDHNLVADDVTAVGGTVSSVADNIITLASAAPANGVKVTVKFNLAVGPATTEGNAANMTLDAGDYQIHFVARARDDMECTRMPNPTRMEFIKHCRPLADGIRV